MTSAVSDIGCIMLAAGSSQRFGADKRRARFADGSTLLDRALSRIPASFVQRILVLHEGDDQLAELYEDTWNIVFAAQAHNGMGHSVAAAMAQTVNWRGAVIALADMPCVEPATTVVIQQRLTPGGIVVPCYRQQRGNPVGIGCEFFPELAALQGDQGARMLFQKHADAVLKLDVNDAGIVQDVDTQQAFEEQMRSTD